VPKIPQALFVEDTATEQENGVLRTEKAANDEPGGSRSAGG
jgi:hypothetical protein